MATPTSLAAVLFVELADFSDLLSSDERAAVPVLSAYRRIADPIAFEHDGDIVDATGSELLLVFSSAVAAMQCALHLAFALRPFGASMGFAGRLEPRMGMHLGEIWRDGGRVYGNGVNIAARVMQAAEAGGFLVSEDVYRQVANKLDLSAREISGAVLKNIERPLVLYEIDTGRGFSTEGIAAEPSVPARPTPVTRHNSGITIGPGAHGGETAKAEGAIQAKTELDPEAARDAARDKASTASSDAIKRLVLSGGVGAALAYGYAVSGKALFLVAVGLFGLLPFISALKRLIASSLELRRIDRLERKAR